MSVAFIYSLRMSSRTSSYLDILRCLHAVVVQKQMWLYCVDRTFLRVCYTALWRSMSQRWKRFSAWLHMVVIGKSITVQNNASVYYLRYDARLFSQLALQMCCANCWRCWDSSDQAMFFPAFAGQCRLSFLFSTDEWGVLLLLPIYLSVQLFRCFAFQLCADVESGYSCIRESWFQRS